MRRRFSAFELHHIPRGAGIVTASAFVFASVAFGVVRGGHMPEVAAATRDIQINKSGFERYVALAARRHRFAYGLACVLLSLGLGWAAAAVFRRRF
jgi:hypothetical protein